MILENYQNDRQNYIEYIEVQDNLEDNVANNAPTANENDTIDLGELQSLTTVGVAQLNLDYQSNLTMDEQGNLLGEQSSAVMADGQTRDLVDVYFQV